MTEEQGTALLAAVAQLQTTAEASLLGVQWLFMAACAVLFFSIVVALRRA